MRNPEVSVHLEASDAFGELIQPETQYDTHSEPQQLPESVEDTMLSEADVNTTAQDPISNPVLAHHSIATQPSLNPQQDKDGLAKEEDYEGEYQEVLDRDTKLDRGVPLVGEDWQGLIGVRERSGSSIQVNLAFSFSPEVSFKATEFSYTQEDISKLIYIPGFSSSSSSLDPLPPCPASGLSFKPTAVASCSRATFDPNSPSKQLLTTAPASRYFAGLAAKPPPGTSIQDDDDDKSMFCARFYTAINQTLGPVRERLDKAIGLHPGIPLAPDSVAVFPSSVESSTQSSVAEFNAYDVPPIPVIENPGPIGHSAISKNQLSGADLDLRPRRITSPNQDDISGNNADSGGKYHHSDSSQATSDASSSLSDDGIESDDSNAEDARHSMSTYTAYSSAGDEETRQALAKKIIASKKQDLIDRTMKRFWILLAQDSSMGTRSHGNDPATTSKNSPIQRNVEGNPSQSRCPNGMKRSLDERDDENDQSPDEDGNNRKPHKIMSRPFQNEDSRTKFGCPYRKYNRQKYTVQKWRSCVLTPLESVARVKSHLYRHHLIFQCPRCKECFEDQRQLDSHFVGINSCELIEVIPVEGVTADLERRLRCRKKKYKGQLEEDRWKDIYQMLFPASEIPNPYFEPVEESIIQSSESRAFLEFEEYSRQELPHVFQSILEDVVNSETGPIEEKLRSRLTEMIKESQNRVFTNYRSMCSSKGLPHSDPQTTMAHSTPFRDLELPENKKNLPNTSARLNETSHETISNLAPSQGYSEIVLASSTAIERRERLKPYNSEHASSSLGFDLSRSPHPGIQGNVDGLDTDFGSFNGDCVSTVAVQDLTILNYGDSPDNNHANINVRQLESRPAIPHWNTDLLGGSIDWNVYFNENGAEELNL